MGYLESRPSQAQDSKTNQFPYIVLLTLNHSHKPVSLMRIRQDTLAALAVQISTVYVVVVAPTWSPFSNFSLAFAMLISSC